jgi:23S rRNA (adenine2503-C2)-methyltransferase
MPINRQHPIEQVMDTLRRLPLAPRRRFTIAYVLIRGENDSLKDARKLVRVLHGLRCKVNLIPFNPYPETGLRRPEQGDVIAFQEFLRSKGISTHIRSSRGGDVLAACGQLSGDAL